MSPWNYQDSDQVMKGVTTTINGSRPSPLRINKDSHAIHKSSSDQNLIHSSSGSPAKNHGGGGGVASKRQQPPVIIYTHPPKVIHAQARDFRALVQKLTGMSRADDDVKTTVKPEPEESGSLYLSAADVKDRGPVMNSNSNSNNNDNNNVGYEETKLTDEITEQQDCSPLYKFPNYPCYDDPIFAPISNDFFCSNNPISPSLMEMMNGYQ
ncbi:hypothetical protein ABFS82_10G046900 [Erythranthe guttata]|nr:PREDICTED: uncharacterized protein LOC105952688 [Erythranthe guttata]|eukprot:XP_012831727.1 PREDICTED: uncharacterized protein LOC105952688 [Erythranthe guttata]